MYLETMPDGSGLVGRSAHAPLESGRGGDARGIALCLEGPLLRT